MKHQVAILLLIVVNGCAVNKTIIPSSIQNEIIASMNKAADDWNKGDLDAFMTLYDGESTFMMPSGTVGIEGMKENYRKGFFNGNMPKQQLSYDEMVVLPLGKDYALLTGKFVLTGGGLKDRSGRYSLVFVRRTKRWKILHDHSS